jgi:RNA polymerase sigma factor (sigma-70 family)
MIRVSTPSELPHDLDSIAGFERLYRAYYGYAWSVLARLGVPPGSIDDAHQDVFVTAYRRRETFERGRPVKPWLVGIARRVAFRYRRSQQRTDRKQSAMSHARGRERPAARSLDARVEAGQFLQAFIEGLEPEQREVFVLAELEGYSGPEIAERLGINLNTAYTRVRTVRGQLRRALGAVEERRVGEVRIDRGLALVLPQLSKPGWLAGLWGSWVETKLGVVAAGVGGVGVVVAVAIGAVSRPEGSNDEGAADRGAVARGDIDGGAKVGPSVAVEDPLQPALPGPSLEPSVASGAGVAPSDLARAPSAATAADAARHEPTSKPGAGTERSVPTADVKSPDVDDGPADLQREIEQLTAARETLAAGKPADALAQLEAHARAHPSSSLDEARAALRIACLCAMDRREQARGEATVLLRRYPGSTLARHAATRCE